MSSQQRALQGLARGASGCEVPEAVDEGLSKRTLAEPGTALLPTCSRNEEA